MCCLPVVRQSCHRRRFMDDDVFRELGIRLVAWDRPGYGQSDPQPQRSFKTFTGA